MKLSDIKGEAALDALADLIEPVAEIVTDTEFVNLVKSNVPRIKLVKPMIKNHKKAVIEILAILDGESPETYEVNITTLPLKLLELFNDPMVIDLFQSQSQTKTSSGSVTEITGAKEN